MRNQYQTALATLAVALFVGGIAQAVAKQQAALLGLSGFELALLGVGVGAFIQRCA